MDMAKSIVDQLAHSLGRRDEQPNIDLAMKIARSGDVASVKELIGLMSQKKTAWAHDAIKVLYETGERKPDLITAYLQDFVKALQHKDNRMKWGAMCALSAISKASPGLLAKHLVTIVEAMDTGSVITRDHGIYILADLARVKKYHKDAVELLLEQMEKAPVNQFPMYAEKTAEVISKPFIPKLISILRKRTDVMEIPSKAKRIEKVMQFLQP